MEDNRYKRRATAFTAGRGEPIPQNCLSGGPGCSSLAHWNLGMTAHSEVLNFTSIPALTQGVSLRPLRSVKDKPIGNTKHQVYDGFRFSVDGWVLLKHCCRTLSCLLGTTVRVWSPKCNPWHDSLAWSCIWWVIISIAEFYYGLFTGHISMWADSHCHRKPLLAYECYYAINCFWYLTDFFLFSPS